MAASINTPRKKMALHTAAENNATEIALGLLSRDVDPNRQDSKGNLPLHYAVRHNNVTLIDALLDEGSLKDHANFNHDTPLHVAVRYGHMDAINKLVDSGCDVNRCKPEGDGLLHTLVSRYSPSYPADFQKVLETLLLAGCDINTVAFCTHETPLYRALSLRKNDIAEILLSYGADPNISCPFDVTALQLACRDQDFRTVILMLHCGIAWKRERWISQVSYFQGKEWQSLLELTEKWKNKCVSLQDLCRVSYRVYHNKNLYRHLVRQKAPLAVKRFIMLYDLRQQKCDTERTFDSVVFSGAFGMPDMSEAYGESVERKSDKEDICVC